jgi:uncharacterized protein YijF (DUF1287 family)
MILKPVSDGVCAKVLVRHRRASSERQVCTKVNDDKRRIYGDMDWTLVVKNAPGEVTCTVVPGGALCLVI